MATYERRKYGTRSIDDAPTNMHIMRRERKYNGHKLAISVDHNFYQRHHGGESVKKNK